MMPTDTALHMENLAPTTRMDYLRAQRSSTQWWLRHIRHQLLRAYILSIRLARPHVTAGVLARPEPLPALRPTQRETHLVAGRPTVQLVAGGGDGARQMPG
jgi:hypothetical protein